MITKEKLKSQIESFPDEISIDELIDRLIFIDKLEKRIRESEEGKTVSEDIVREESKSWSR
jgi:hypothetical protein